MNIIDNVLSRLGGVRECGDGWQAHCPSHDDQKQSLHVSEGRDGRVLLYCHAGCSVDDVCRAMGLEVKDLFPEQERKQPRLSRIAKAYDYTDEAGNLLFQVCRMVPKTFRQRQPCPRGGDCGEVDRKGRQVCRQDQDGRWWHWNLEGVRRVPYRLPKVIEAIKNGDTVFVVEGEKDVHSLEKIGLVATTNPGGAGKWMKEYSMVFSTGSQVVIVPDNDPPGRNHAEKVAEQLAGRGVKVKVLELPGLPEKGDVSDWLAAGGRKEELLKLAAEAPEWEPENTETADKDEEEGSKKATQSQELIALAAGVELFHTPDETCYATVVINGHNETLPIRAKSHNSSGGGFRRWLLRQFYERQGKPPGAQALQDALGVIEAQAMFDGPEVPVFIRLAEKGGNVYLDLANEAWQAVEITPNGWRVVDNPPVKFRRAKGMLPLPTPEPGGSIKELCTFVNVPDEASWRLLVAWLVAAMMPTGPYPVLLLQGEQGSAKSTTARVLRALVDPSTAPLRTVPRDERDLAIAANNAWVVAFDNLSGIPAWLSDAICRLATGGGFSTRELYTDAEEILFDAMRPVVLNGIDDLANRHDLLDRALVLNLPPIPEQARRDEKDFWHEFEQARPRILGAVLDVVIAGLRNLDSVKLDRLPRMADFAKWVTACEPALPWPAGDFLKAYTGNRTEAVELALEADPVAVAVRALLAMEDGEWEGSATKLLNVLEEYVPEQTQRTKAWPKSANYLSNRLRRAATFLRQMGIEVEWLKDHTAARKRLIRISTKSIDPTDLTDREEPESQATQRLVSSDDNTVDRPRIVRRSSGPKALGDNTSDDRTIPDDKKPTLSKDRISPFASKVLRNVRDQRRKAAGGQK